MLGCPHNATISLGFHLLPLTVLLYPVLIIFTFFLAVELLSWTEITLWILIINDNVADKTSGEDYSKGDKITGKWINTKGFYFVLITHEYPQNLTLL